VREIVFSRNNNDRWEQTEQILRNNESCDPDTLAKLFVQLTDDLAYAQTYYPKSKTTAYLNQLAMLAHQRIYISKKKNLNRIYQFFVYNYPLLIYKNYKYLLYSFLIFGLAILIGAYSAHVDEEFLRLIVGDGYVNKTLENIKNGDPIAIYGDSDAFPMFVRITLNNIQVAIFAFLAGAFFSLGTGFILFQNGVMLGAFQYFFRTQGVLLVSASGIWMHGTIEIFSIVVAGAAGLRLGNSFLFPGTYSRLKSFQQGAKEGIKIVFGLIPFFIIAGFIESYLTRHYELSWLSIFIIGSSILLITYYFFIYPYILHKRICKQNLN
jgi:uncharacterized membrane protein SpoIIM required for sporulation